MKMTAKLKGWLVETGRASQDSTDEELKAAAAQAIVDGDLTTELLTELTTDDKEAAVDKLASVIEEAIQPIAKAVAANASALEDIRNAEAAKAVAKVEEQVAEAAEKLAAVAPVESPGRELPQQDSELTKSLIDNGAANVRLKGAQEQYSDTKSAARYSDNHRNGFLRGRSAQLAGRSIDHSSQLDNAICGAWFKFAANASAGNTQLPRGLRMTDHDKQLIDYALHEKAWTGIINGAGSEDHGAVKVDNRKLSAFEVKALIDDSTSGGLEVAPIAFDDAVILTPLLHGELFPLVNTINISRGRRVEGASIGNPTFASVAEGTAITEFNTSSFVSAFDTTIFNAVGAMEIGLDLEEDSPVNLGALVAQAYGEQALKWLDDQIANGDGTTEPQGVFRASGIGTVASANGVTGPPKVDDYEGLLFGVAKEFRNPADRERSVFMGSETSYSRARGIAVGSADVRRVFGSDHEDYRLLGHPYKVNESLGNNNTVFANLRHYRMYRRLGLNIRVESGGKELALKNLSLIVVRMRYGGKLEQGGAGAYTADAQN